MTWCFVTSEHLVVAMLSIFLWLFFRQRASLPSFLSVIFFVRKFFLRDFFLFGFFLLRSHQGSYLNLSLQVIYIKLTRKETERAQKKKSNEGVQNAKWFYAVNGCQYELILICESLSLCFWLPGSLAHTALSVRRHFYPSSSHTNAHTRSHVYIHSNFSCHLFHPLLSWYLSVTTNLKNKTD